MSDRKRLTSEDTEIFGSDDDPDKRKVDTNIGLGEASTCLFLVAVITPPAFLAIPKVTADAGWFGILLLVTMCGLLTYTTALLGRCVTILQDRYFEFRHGHHRYPYAAIGEITYGRPGRLLVRISTNVTNFGTAVVCLLLASDSISHALAVYIDLPFCYTLLILSALLMPFMLCGTPKDFWLIAILTTIATIIASGLIFAAILDDRATITENDAPSDGNHYFYFVFVAFGTLAFAFSVHSIFPNIQMDMRDPSRFLPATVTGYCISLLIILPPTMASFFVFGKSVSPNVIASLPDGTPHSLSTLLMAVVMAMSVVISVNPVCQELEELAGVSENFTWKRLISRTSVLLAVVIVSETLPHFSAILALIGGSTIAFMAFLFPAFFYLKLHKMEPEDGEVWEKANLTKTTRIVCYGIIITGVAAGVCTTLEALKVIMTSSLSVPCYINPRAAQL